MRRILLALGLAAVLGWIGLYVAGHIYVPIVVDWDGVHEPWWMSAFLGVSYTVRNITLYEPVVLNATVLDWAMNTVVQYAYLSYSQPVSVRAVVVHLPPQCRAADLSHNVTAPEEVGATKLVYYSPYYGYEYYDYFVYYLPRPPMLIYLSHPDIYVIPSLSLWESDANSQASVALFGTLFGTSVPFAYTDANPPAFLPYSADVVIGMVTPYGYLNGPIVQFAYPSAIVVVSGTASLSGSLIAIQHSSLYYGNLPSYVYDYSISYQPSGQELIVLNPPVEVWCAVS